MYNVHSTRMYSTHTYSSTGPDDLTLFVFVDRRHYPSSLERIDDPWIQHTVRYIYMPTRPVEPPSTLELRLTADIITSSLKKTTTSCEPQWSYF